MGKTKETRPRRLQEQNSYRAGFFVGVLTIIIND
jgi:hypothetical protein